MQKVTGKGFILVYDSSEYSLNVEVIDTDLMVLVFRVLCPEEQKQAVSHRAAGPHQ